jgi:cupin superfamily acireductone dioxygenase involved in methionine salvage
MTSVTFIDRATRTLVECLGPQHAPAALRALDVQTGSWVVRTQPVSSMPQLTYARELNALQRRFGSVLIDRVRGRPSGLRRHGDSGEAWPELPEEHVHQDDEVRVVLAGIARFVVSAPAVGGWAVIECSPGDWVALPSGLPHAFAADPVPGVDMLRLFSRPRGWVAEPTGSTVPPEVVRWSRGHDSPRPAQVLAA